MHGFFKVIQVHLGVVVRLVAKHGNYENHEAFICQQRGSLLRHKGAQVQHSRKRTFSWRKGKTWNFIHFKKRKKKEFVT